MQSLQSSVIARPDLRDGAGWQMSPIIRHARMSFSVTLNTELHWVRGRKKKREMFFMHTWRLSCTPNSPFSYEGGAASENRCSGFDVDVKQRVPMKAETVGIGFYSFLMEKDAHMFFFIS